jgi:hypothetical protein
MIIKRIYLLSVALSPLGVFAILFVLWKVIKAWANGEEIQERSSEADFSFWLSILLAMSFTTAAYLCWVFFWVPFGMHGMVRLSAFLPTGAITLITGILTYVILKILKQLHR